MGRRAAWQWLALASLASGLVLWLCGSAAATGSSSPNNHTAWLTGLRTFRRNFLQACYGKYGCFSIDYPWYSSHRVVNLFPKKLEEMPVHFFVYTRRNPRRLQIIEEDDKYAARRSHINPTKPTFIVIHGYFEHGHKNWVQELKHELLARGDFNVVVVDWLSGSGPPYTQATANTRLVGAISAHYVFFLHRALGLDPLHTHCVGHSLGAHTCGYVGSHLRRDFGLELGRISGLDPAQPHFERTHPMMRLDPSDAYYVDVIHTNANPILSGGLGVWQPCGHLDFYPNGGRSMAGCNRGIALALQEERGNYAYALRRAVGCNHIRAYEYFIESINTPCPFIGVECPSWEDFLDGACTGCLAEGDPKGCDHMGFSAFAQLGGARPQRSLRQLFLLTQDDKPFCAYHFRVTIVISDTEESYEQGGDRGNFRMVLNGEKRNSTTLLLNRETAYFEAGRAYHFITTTQDLGPVHSADLIWEYAFHPFNPFTWRVFSRSRMYVNRIEIDQLGYGRKLTFCADDRAFVPMRPRRVPWKASCRDSARLSASIFGAVLNADPVGSATYILQQVNPLNMNPLNGLEQVSTLFTGFASRLQRVGPAIKRWGNDLAARWDNTNTIDAASKQIKKS